MSEGPGYAGRTGAVLELIDVTRTFKQGAVTLRIFREAGLTVQAGEIVALGRLPHRAFAAGPNTSDDAAVTLPGGATAGASRLAGPGRHGGHA